MTKTVADVMTRDPIAVHPETTLHEAIQILAEKRISGLPVIDAAGQLAGVISETDLMWQESGVSLPAYIMLLDSVIYLENPARHDRNLHKALGQTVADAMTKRKDVITIQPGQTVREAAHVMNERKVHRLLVLDGGENVIGVITRGDIIRYMAAVQ
jgi:CBS domain-containing protein